MNWAFSRIYLNMLIKVNYLLDISLWIVQYILFPLKLLAAKLSIFVAFRVFTLKTLCKIVKFYEIYLHRYYQETTNNWTELYILKHLTKFAKRFLKQFQVMHMDKMYIMQKNCIIELCKCWHIYLFLKWVI